MTNPKIFEKYGFVQVEEFLDSLTISTVSEYLENRIKRGEWQSKDPEDNVTRFFCYADPLIEVILKKCLPLVEEVCGKQLLPTYSYARIYQAGEALKSHLDRPSCEVSVTVSVAYKGEPNSFWIHYGDNEPIQCMLKPGDAVVYKGCEAKHWRHKLKDDQLVVQFMLHYVDKNGPYVKYIFDTRESLGLSEKHRNIH